MREFQVSGCGGPAEERDYEHAGSGCGRSEPDWPTTGGHTDGGGKGFYANYANWRESNLGKSADL